MPSPSPRIRDHAPARHSVRIDLLDEDYTIIDVLSTQLGWSINQTLREIAHAWVRDYNAGDDRGVIPTVTRRAIAQ